MYKTRLKLWGLTKNLKAPEASQISRKALTSSRVELPVIRGREIGGKRFRSYLSHMAARRSSMPKPIASPNELRLREGSILSVVHWARGCMQDNIFGITGEDYNWSGDIGMGIWSNINSAITKCGGEKGESTIDFRILNKAFSWYSSAIDAGEPSLVWISLVSVLNLSVLCGQDLANSFSRYVASLCNIKLGPIHPLTRLWVMVNTMSPEAFRAAVPTILDAYFTAFESDHRLAEVFRKVSMLHTFRHLNLRGLMSFETASTRMQAIIREFRDAGGCEDLSNDWYWWSQLQYAVLLYEARRYEEANKALVPVGAYMHNGYPDFTYDKIRPNTHGAPYYHRKAEVLEALGRVDDATAYHIGRYEYCKLSGDLPHDYHPLTRAALALESHYRRKGDNESAGLFRDESKAYLEALARQDIADILVLKYRKAAKPGDKATNHN
jgi:hypothetical protein